MDQYPTAATTAELETIASRIAPLGWHIEINIDEANRWVELESWLPGDAVREPLFAKNAAKLYRFAK